MRELIEYTALLTELLGWCRVTRDGSKVERDQGNFEVFAHRPEKGMVFVCNYGKGKQNKHAKVWSLNAYLKNHKMYTYGGKTYNIYL